MKKQKVTSAKFDAEDIEIRYCRLIYIDLFRKGDYLSLVKIYAAALDHPIKDQFKLSNNENQIVKYYKSALNKSDKNWDYPFYEKTLFAFNLIAVGYEEEGFRELTSIYFFLINNKYQLVLRSIPYNKKITKQVLEKFKKYLTEKGDKTAADQIDRNFIQE
jgi:hypothetical protein